MSPGKIPTHEHHWFTAQGRGWRICRGGCWARQWLINGVWRDAMTAQKLAEKWCPKVAGPEPEVMMRVEVAEAFEWNCYESWNEVVRVRFDFSNVVARQKVGQGTRTDVMNGWRSGWHQDFCQVDAEAQAYYKQRTGRDYQIGDECYAEMRAFIQQPIGPPPVPRLVPDDERNGPPHSQHLDAEVERLPE